MKKKKWSKNKLPHLRSVKRGRGGIIGRSKRRSVRKAGRRKNARYTRRDVDRANVRIKRDRREKLSDREKKRDEPKGRVVYMNRRNGGEN